MSIKLTENPESETSYPAPAPVSELESQKISAAECAGKANTALYGLKLYEIDVFFSKKNMFPMSSVVSKRVTEQMRVVEHASVASSWEQANE